MPNKDTGPAQEERVKAVCLILLPQTNSGLLRLAQPTAQRGVLMCGMALIESVERSVLGGLDWPGVDSGVALPSPLLKNSE